METKERKFIAIFIAILIMIIIMPLRSNADEEENTDEVDLITTAEEFVEAIRKQESSIITISGDIDLSNLNPNSENPDTPVALNVSGKTIDLNKHKISANNLSVAFVGTNFTIKNGTFDSKGGSYALFIGDEEATNNVVIEDITTIGGINICNANNVIIKSTIVEGTNYYAIWCDEKGEATIESGTFNSAATVSNTLLGISKEGGELNIEGGTFIIEEKNLALNEKDEEGNDKYNKPEISGGIFDVSVPEEYCSEGFEPIKLGEKIYSVCNHANVILRNEREATIESNRIYRGCVLYKM